MAKINISQFAILSERPPEDNIEYDIGLGFKYSLEGQRIAAEFSYSYEDDKGKFLLLDISCEFDVHPDDWNAAIKENVLTIPKVMLEYFAAQTVGTARGILHCKTEGTPFNYLIIPSVNVSKMIASDLVVPLD